MTTILLLIIYLIFISLGLPDSLLGAAWPVAHVDLGVPVSLAGLTSVFITVGTVASSLVAVMVVRRFGVGMVSAVSVLLTATALLCISYAQSYFVICLLSVPLGLGAGSIDAALNNYVANHYKSVQMNLLHAFWGVGATCGPLVMSAFLMQNGNWHGGYRATAVIQLCIAAAAFSMLPIWKRAEREDNGALDGARAQIAGNREALRTPGVLMSMLAFFFYCAAEMGTGLWAATYYVAVKHVAPETAAGYGSLFFAGVMLGRVAAGCVSARVGEAQLIGAGILLALLGTLCMLLLPMPAAVAGLLMIGLGCAPIFPNMLQLTPRRFGARVSQAAVSLQMAAAYLGSTLTPPLFGFLGGRLGFGLLPYFLLGCLLAVAFLSLRLNRRAAANAQTAAESEACA